MKEKQFEYVEVEGVQKRTTSRAELWADIVEGFASRSVPDLVRVKLDPALKIDAKTLTVGLRNYIAKKHYSNWVKVLKRGKDVYLEYVGP